MKKKYQKTETKAEDKTEEKPNLFLSASVQIGEPKKSLNSSDRLAELRQKYQKNQESSTAKPNEKDKDNKEKQPAVENKLDELKKKYQRPEQLLSTGNRASEPSRMGKSVSTSHVANEHKSVWKWIILEISSLF